MISDNIADARLNVILNPVSSTLLQKMRTGFLSPLKPDDDFTIMSTRPFSMIQISAAL